MSPTAFALRELTACWDQAYDALGRGDLEQVASLMNIVDSLLEELPPASEDSTGEKLLRRAAMAARGRLAHGMQAGLEGMRDELAKIRTGSRALKGYKIPTQSGDRVLHDA